MLNRMDTADTILTGDCLAVVPTLPAGSASLVFLDPPFNIGLEYPGYLIRGVVMVTISKGTVSMPETVRCTNAMDRPGNTPGREEE
jgi:hypothetical protein